MSVTSSDAMGALHKMLFETCEVDEGGELLAATVALAGNVPVNMHRYLQFDKVKCRIAA